MEGLFAHIYKNTSQIVVLLSLFILRMFMFELAISLSFYCSYNSREVLYTLTHLYIGMDLIFNSMILNLIEICTEGCNCHEETLNKSSINICQSRNRLDSIPEEVEKLNFHTKDDNVKSNINVYSDVKIEVYSNQVPKEDTSGQRHGDLLFTNTDVLKPVKQYSNCRHEKITVLSRLIVRLLIAFSVQLLIIIVLPVSCKVCLYVMNIISIGMDGGKCIQGIESVSEEDNDDVLTDINDYFIKLEMTPRQTSLLSEERAEPSILRMHLKDLMKEYTKTSPYSKQKLISSLLPNTADYIERPKVNLYPFASSLQSCLDEIQAVSEFCQDHQMRYEIWRLMSFCGSSILASAFRLAQSGFYAVGGAQQTRCFSCRISYSEWRMMDRPDIVHRRISPECPHISGNDDRNIPIYPDLRHEDTHQRTNGVIKDYPPGPVDGILTSSISQLTLSEGQNATATTPMSLDISKAVYPQYRDSKARLDSYQGWGWSHVQDPRILAVAGFYYAGYRDCVRCFYCGVGLRTWEKEDDPWVEHVRWRSSCDYVRCTRGETFVIEALAGNTSSSATALPLQQENDSTVTSQLGYQASDDNNTRQTATELSELTSTSTAQGRTSTSPQSSTVSTEQPPSESTRDADPACSLTGITSAWEVMRTTPVDTTNVRTSEVNEMQPIDEKIISHGSSNIGDPQILQRQLEEENQSLRDESTCKVCLDNPSCIVFLPCGHLVTCAECAPALRKCPICRALIRGTIRAYSAS